jgi:hypothetical protein
MSERQEAERRKFENLMRETKELVTVTGNAGKVTEEQIRKHCTEVAERANRETLKGE